MTDQTKRLIRRTYLVLVFIPWALLTLTNILSGYALDFITSGHAWVMRKTPIARKFAK